MRWRGWREGTGIHSMSIFEGKASTRIRRKIWFRIEALRNGLQGIHSAVIAMPRQLLAIADEHGGKSSAPPRLLERQLHYPIDRQGQGEEGLKILRDVGQKYDMPVVTEVMDPRRVSHGGGRQCPRTLRGR